jgi:hypothetical protein
MVSVAVAGRSQNGNVVQSNVASAPRCEEIDHTLGGLGFLGESEN